MRFLLVSIFLIFSLSSFAQQVGVIKSRFAIIYADKDCRAPIGQISHGKKVLVGKLPLAQGKSLPIYINNQVLYIKIEDLITEEGTLTPKGEKSLSVEEALEKVEKYGRLYATTREADRKVLSHSFSSSFGGMWVSGPLTDRLKDESVSYLFTGFNIGYKITSLRSPVYTSIGLSYYQLNTKVAAMDLPVLSIGMGYNGKLGSKASFHFGIEALGNYFTKFEIKEVSRKQNDINGFGAALTSDFNLNLSDSFRIFISGKYSILRNQNVNDDLKIVEELDYYVATAGLSLIF